MKVNLESSSLIVASPDENTERVKIRIADVPPKAETQKKRYQAKFKPSVFKALEVRAKKRGQSVNSLINQLIEAYINATPFADDEGAK